jgi:hypothetical protein
MNKKTKMWLGVGVVAAAAYYFWNKSKTPATTSTTATTPAKQLVGADAVFANAAGCPSGYSYSINSLKQPVCDNGKGHRYKTNRL